MDTPFAREGSSTIQLSGLKTHAESESHKRAEQIIREQLKPTSAPITKKIEIMVDAEKARIISVMETMYFVAINDFSLESFKKICDYVKYIGAPNRPLTDEYSTYTNITTGKEFMQASKEVYWSKLKKEINGSPFYSILVDESTDRTLQQHLIVYISYLTNDGKGPCVTKFVRLLKIKDGTAQSMYDSVTDLLLEMELPLKKMVGFGSDGASSMRGIHRGLAAKLQSDTPHLVVIHCIAHREALAANDASSRFPELQFVDKMANKVYSWLGKSVKRHGDLRELMESFQMDKLEVLQIHHVRWLSRGQVMERLVKIMPALLEEWKREDIKLYQMATIFQVQFCIHLLVDVLIELNKLNKRFQEEHIDVTSIGVCLDIVVDILRRKFLRRSFDSGIGHTSSFLKKAKHGTLDFVDAAGTLHSHPLRFESLPDSLGAGTLQDCINLGKAFVQKTIDCLDERFADLPIFNAAKFFSPHNYHEEEAERDADIDRWLERLCEKFNVGESPIIDIERCYGEKEEFIINLCRAQPKRSMFAAWEHCGGELEWIESFPNLIKLWQIILFEEGTCFLIIIKDLPMILIIMNSWLIGICIG